MNDLASLNAKTFGTVEANGRTYTVHPLTLADLGELQAGVDSQAPDPFDAVSEQLGTGRFTPAQERHLLDGAIKAATARKPRIGEEEADERLRTFEGLKQIVYLGIKRGDHSITLAEVSKIVEELDPAQLAKVLNATEADKAIGDPKE
ncbi:MAG: hypothetical protein NVSMB14_12780 [Isosphaeraceae bacterium]